ncbi:MAG: hypothetical protein K8R85_14840, partial [Bacteroidetes bacterium]|nr:hypothetical protein [Bacteroidota bacterium]
KDIAKTTNKIPLGEKANSSEKNRSEKNIVCKYGFHSQFKNYFKIRGNDRINFEYNLNRRLELHLFFNN